MVCLILSNWENHVSTRWAPESIQDPKTKKTVTNNFWVRHFATRAAYTGLIPAMAIGHILDTIFFLGSLVISTLSFHRFGSLWTIKAGLAVMKGLPQTGHCAVRALNPKAALLPGHEIEKIFCPTASLAEFAMNNMRSNNSWFNRHVTNKLGVVLTLAALLITSVVGHTFGIGSTVFSILTLGTSKELNSFSYRQLQNFGLFLLALWGTSKIFTLGHANI